MSRSVSLLTLSALFLSSPAFAGPLAPPPPLPYRLAQADCVIVGKVVSIEEDTVLAPSYPGARKKVEYQIAIIKIEDPLLCAKGLTHVRVGFIQMAPAELRLRPGPQFAKDQEVCVLLQAHEEGDFHVVPGFYDCFDKKTNPNYEKEVAEIKRLTKMLSEPKESLKAKAAADRYLAAAMLVARYRWVKPNVRATGEAAIDAEVSKLILEAFAEVDWKNDKAQFYQMYPTALFQLLGLTEKDGWKPPMTTGGEPIQIDLQKLPDAAKLWCKDNADKYRIKQFVYTKND